MSDDIRSVLRRSLEVGLPTLFRSSKLIYGTETGLPGRDCARGAAVRLIRVTLPGSRSWAGGIVLALVILFSSTIALRALDPRKQIGQYGHDTWTPERGLLGEAVYQILQSKDGYLWIRTGSGLSRFDGVRFTSVDAEIGGSPAKAICMNADGDLLVQTMMRTVVYKNGRFTDYLPAGSVPGIEIRALFESREHVLFVGENDFLYKMDMKGEATMLRGRSSLINSFLQDHTGKIWISANAAIFTYSADGIAESLILKAFGGKISSLMEDRRHRLWAATAKGLFRLDEKGANLNTVHQQGIPDLVTAALEDSQGNMWVGTETKGLFLLRSGKVSSMTYGTGLTDETVLSLFEDREGSIWIGTANGLDRLRDTDLTTFTTREGLPSNLVNSVIATRDGAVDLFTDNGGLASIKNDVVATYPDNAKLASLGGNALFESRDGSIWIGTLRGLSRIKDGKVTVYNSDYNLLHLFTSVIIEDNEGLIVYNSGLWRFKDGKLTAFTIHGKKTAISNNQSFVATICRDSEGTLWFGTPIGLFRQPPDEPSGGGWQAKVNFAITSIFDDHRGNLWLGGITPGLVQFRIRDGRVTHFTARDGLFDNFLTSVLEDDERNLWISTEHGIYSVSTKTLDDFADGKISWIPSRRYGLEDGMKTTAASSQGSQPAGARTPDGKLWFATVKGIVTVDPQHLMHNSLIPPVSIESVVADGAEQSLGDSLEIKPGVKAIEIHYTALSLRIAERVRFKYQLEGYDHEWVDPGTRRVAYYMNVPPGKYRFHVIACNDDGLWNDQGSELTVVLKPRFYQTWLFYAACILFALMAMVAVNLSYTRVIRARARSLSKIVDQRTAELQESHRELELVAHFDPLTTLPNRRMFVEDFRKMLVHKPGSENEFALLLLDFDRFKEINDTFGHDVGDLFLIESAKRLTALIRSTDCVARLGGDEFAILVTGDRSQAGIVNVCDRIVHSLSAPINFRGAQISTTVSLGAAMFREHGDTEKELYKAADLALYEAKRRGRNNWCWYSSELHDRVAGKHEVVASAPGVSSK
jgi:diguanylate cyclase (GGDEF)-like protein